VKIAAWCVLVVLAVVGIAVAIERAADTILYASDTPALSPIERTMLDALARQLEMERGSAAFALAERNLLAASGKYRLYSGATLLHVLPGIIVLALGLTQFSRAIRTRHPRLHRVCGRIVLVALLAAALSGFFFGVAMPYGGKLETAATVVFGAFMVYAGALAYAAIRRREIATHREWMIRMFAIALGIAVMRVLSVVWLTLLPAPEIATPRAFGMLLWVGWLLTLAVAELWIRRTRGERHLDEASAEGIGGVVVAGRRGMPRAHQTVD
jgi:uncharacterized membrane protein